MRVDTIIGGEFECIRKNVNSVSCNFAFSPYTFSSGRTALYNIVTYCIDNLKCNRMILPDYLCGSIIETVMATGITIDFYHVQTNLIPERNSIWNKTAPGGGNSFYRLFWDHR